MKNILTLGLLAGLSLSAHAATVGVTVMNGRFVPEHVQIQVGDTIEFTNRSTGTHTVTADPALAKDPHNVALPPGVNPFNSGALKPGAVFTHTFAVAGDYAYVCLPHERMGMLGSVSVVEAN